MRVGIEILTKNRPEYVGMLLQSLRDQTCQDFDVFILDESNTPITKYFHINALLTRLALDEHYVWYAQNTFTNNIGLSRNKLFEADHNPLHLRIDDDCVMNPTYIESLRETLLKYNAGAVGGVTPTVSAPNIIRDSSELKYFETITFDKEGNLTMTDNGGYVWSPEVALPTHHIRSSFLFTTDAALNSGLHPTEYGPTGFREETVFCMKMIWGGYKLYSDLRAKAWHFRAPGGAHEMHPQEYQQRIAINDQHFRRWAKWMYDRFGWR
jgi:GT2 family glycosyltransferase